MRYKERTALDKFIQMTEKNMNDFAANMTPEYYAKTIALILEAQAKGGRIHVTGIGKPGHVASYIASLLSSVGTPSTFLHGTEAVHGSCGQLVEGDVVICISNSGETQEMKNAVRAIKNFGCRVIGVTGRQDSWLAQESDACLIAGVSEEGGPLNRAPISSVLLECLALQGLAVILETMCGFTPVEYIKRHPSGTLGKLRENEQ